MDKALNLSTILRERALADFGIDDIGANDLANFIVHSCFISQENADCLAWAESCGLESDEIDRLASFFGLHRDLLACVVGPTSNEILLHVVQEVAANELYDEECATCEDISSRIDHGGEGRDALLSICFEMLNHLVMPDGDLDHDDTDESNQALEGVLLPAFHSLNPAAQLRVLAYTYQELAETEDGRRAASFSAYAKLRNEALTPLASRVFDLLAESPEGTLSAEAIVVRLDLANARPLGQLSRSVTKAVNQLASEGFVFEEAPLSVSRYNNKTELKLSSDAIISWQALLRADKSRSAVSE